jgi:trans-L-3-hydroxyproline dehydratase
MHEPRGHADMYGAIITDPVTDDSDFGVFFLHNEGYSTMCGHSIITLTKLVIVTGMIKHNGDDPIVNIDAPAGRIVATAKIVNGAVNGVSFINVPSYVYLSSQEVYVENVGTIKFDIAFGGAYYALVEMEQLGISMNVKNHSKLIRYEKLIKNAINREFKISHPTIPELGFLYGTIFYGNPLNTKNHSRNVCIFAEGELDRSPTGTGVSARAAFHFKNGEMEIGKPYSIESILGTTMTVEILKATRVGPYSAIIPRVSATAYITGMNEFVFFPSDPLRNGFIFR